MTAPLLKHRVESVCGCQFFPCQQHHEHPAVPERTVPWKDAQGLRAALNVALEDARRQLDKLGDIDPRNPIYKESKVKAVSDGLHERIGIYEKALAGNKV